MASHFAHDGIKTLLAKISKRRITAFSRLEYFCIIKLSAQKTKSFLWSAHEIKIKDYQFIYLYILIDNVYYSVCVY